MASTTAAPDSTITPPATTRAGADASSPSAPAVETPSFDEARSLVFRAGGRVYACDVAAVREVVPLDAHARLTRLPGAPDTIIGLLNVRGAIVTVVDGGALLHGASITSEGAMALIVDRGRRGVGLAVDRVADVRALREEEGYQQLDVRALVSRAVSITEE